MIMIFLLGAIVALLGPSFVYSDCGRKPAFARVINGQNAQAHAWPWQVSLRKNGYHSCGGSLISDRWVVTAAHCVQRDPDPSKYTLVVGAHQRLGLTSVEQHLRVSKIIKHSKYGNLENDIALMQLATPVKFDSMGKVGTVCLTSQRPTPGKRCYITGWGATQGGGSLPNILQQAMLPIASHDDCKRKYGRVNPTAHLCAGEAKNGASGGCNGDSGGPLVCEDNGKWYLHGAVSFGKLNCPTTHYTVFARVASYTDWIKQHTGVGTAGSGGGGSPPPPPPPTNAPPPPPPDCKDRASNCQQLKQYCDHPSWISIREKWCRKTCGTCGNPPPPTNPPPPPPPTNNPPPPTNNPPPPPPPTNNPPPPPPPTSNPPPPPPPTNNPPPPPTNGPPSGQCGRKPAFARVINGQDAQAHAWPWQISLRRYGGHSCGGSLISDRWVVTAAHCVQRNPNPSGYTVVVGAHERRGSTSVQQTLRLSQVIKHPQYDDRRIVNDIALLQLATPVKFDSMGKVGTVCLTSQRPTTGKRCYITGWGATRGGGSLPNILQQAMLPVASHENCKRKYGSVSSMAHLCAGEARAGASGGCNGDSGGPLVCEDNGRWYLHGAVSYGLRNCPTTHYTVFARVASYTDWIKQNTGVAIDGSGGGGDGGSPPPPPPPTNAPPPPPPDCKDKASNCQDLQKYCNHPSWHSIKDKWCRKTCKAC